MLNLKKKCLPIKGLDLTPLVDVIFNLIIFFMLTSSFVAETGLPVDLPKMSEPGIISSEGVKVILMKDGRIYIANEEVSKEALTGKLSATSAKERGVEIFPDKDVSIGRTLEVWDICKKQGISKINVRVRQE